jgi:hypothetical protein
VFHVWLLNLTHADLYGEETWFRMTPSETNVSSPPQVGACPPFVSNATDDPWRRADLWQDAVPCAPTPRWGHVTTVLNGYLYVFHGYSSEDGPPDSHVYRISLADVLANSWSAWRRILPRGSLINSMYSIDIMDGVNVTHVTHLEGGLWQDCRNDGSIPKLVAFALTKYSLGYYDRIDGIDLQYGFTTFQKMLGYWAVSWVSW